MLRQGWREQVRLFGLGYKTSPLVVLSMVWMRLKLRYGRCRTKDMKSGYSGTHPCDKRKERFGLGPERHCVLAGVGRIEEGQVAVVKELWYSVARHFRERPCRLISRIR